MYRFVMTAWLVAILCIPASVAYSEEVVSETLAEKIFGSEDEEEVSSSECTKVTKLLSGINVATFETLYDEIIPCLNENQDIELVIDSTGGQVRPTLSFAEAVAASKHPERLTTTVHGLAASAAVIFMLVGKERQIGCYSRVFLHRVTGGVSGNTDKMRANLDTQEEMERFYIDIISIRTGLSSEKIKDMMKEETYLNAQEALEQKFATKIIGCYK